jgi:voltage-gated potassium channel
VKTLKQIIEQRDTVRGRTFDLAIQALIVVSLITFSIETLPDLSPTLRNLLHAIELITVVIFTVEYILRVIIADNKIRFITSFFGVIDLVAILPFYVTAGIDLRAFRAFRLLRLFRIFKLARYSVAVRRFHRAFLIAREEIVLFFCVTVILLFLAAVGIYYFENQAQPERFRSVFHSLWWAVATLTTVGYGDVYPITAGGRIFTFFVLLIGLGIVSVPAGLVSSALSKAREFENPC